MNTKTMILGFLLGVGTSCNDRPIEPAKSDVPSEEARVAACRGWCEQVDECNPTIGREGVENMDACVDGCLTEGTYFTARYEKCWDEAIAALDCMNALTCDEFTLTSRPDYNPAVDGRGACSGTDEIKDPGPMTLHGNCIADVNAAD